MSMPNPNDPRHKKFMERVDAQKLECMNTELDWPTSKAEVLNTWECAGLKCMIINSRVCLCGYVMVPTSHPDFGKWYDDVDVDVHGGLTFCQRVNGGMWFGFDTGHAGDYLPVLGLAGGRLWSENDVARETEKLARQLAERAT